jgi:hypothetical protein
MKIVTDFFLPGLRKVELSGMNREGEVIVANFVTSLVSTTEELLDRKVAAPV